MSTTGLNSEQEAQLAQYVALGDSFTKTYYATFDSNRAGVVPMYVSKTEK